MILSLTVMPVLASLGLGSKPDEKDIWLIRMLKKVYKPVLDAVVMRPLVAVVLALALIGVSVPVALNLGGEFMPKLNEGDLLVEAVRLPSASLEGAVEASTQIENVLKKFPEVRMVYCKTGRPEIANDVMGVHQTDVWTMLKPQSEWREGLTRDGLIEEMDKALTESVPGVKFGFSQPIEMRVNELVAGVKSDVAALISGPDLDELRKVAADVEHVLSKIPGAQDLKSPSAGRLPMLKVVVRRDQLARYGIKAADVLDSIAALGGTTVGTVFEGQVRSPIQVRLPESWRNNPERIESIRILDPQGRSIALRDLADISKEEGPNEVERANVQRRAGVGVNVRGRDLAGFVAEAQKAIDKEVKRPPGYIIRWGGQFEHLATATQRLLIVVPLALALIGLLLYMTLGSMKLAALIFMAVPMAATGGIFALAIRELPFSISAGVGFIALFGVAVLNGLVWVSAVEHLRLEGVEPHAAAEEAALVRLRPVLMTALVAGFGFVPMALSTPPGAEIQRPLATVVIGGLVTSTLLTLLVLPSIYPWFAAKTPKKDTDGLPIVAGEGSEIVETRAV
jgi:cobalt-zinc-cadmium resistance protein CzcA